MSRRWKFLVALLGIQAGLSAAAAALDWTYACGACKPGAFSLGPVGFAFYTGLFLAALWSGPHRLLYGAVLFAFGIHVMLAVQLVALGLVCWICFAAAANAAVLAALAVACDRANVGRLAAALPWSILLVVGWTALPRLESAPEAAVRLTVYTQPGCSLCETLRERILPGLRKEFGPRLEAVERSAGDLPGIRRTPTLILASGRPGVKTQVIEGLPDYDTLRGAVLRAEGKP